MPFERIVLKQALDVAGYGNQPHPVDNQLNLFDN